MAVKAVRPNEAPSMNISHRADLLRQHQGAPEEEIRTGTEGLFLPGKLDQRQRAYFHSRGNLVADDVGPAA
jgi:hypothetical protein